MSIVTKPFIITRKEFFEIYKIFYYHSNSTRLLFGLYFCIGILSITVFPSWMSSFGIGLLSADIVLLIQPYIINADRLVDKYFYKEKTYRIDDDCIGIMFENGSYSIIKLDKLVKVVKLINGYFLMSYIQNRRFQYECFPMSVFYSQDDVCHFMNILKHKKLLPK